MVASIPNDIFQFSTYAALKAGFATGQPRAADLTTHGTHGIGIFEDGQLMILKDSHAYSINDTGEVNKASPQEKLPFAMVTIFEQEMRAKVRDLTTEDLEKLLSDSSIGGGSNSMMPFQLYGTFKSVDVRPGMDGIGGNTATKEGENKSFADISGTVFGFIVPIWMKDISGPRVHAHFISEASSADGKRYGGRVVKFTTEGMGELQFAKCGRFHLGFPQVSSWDTIKLHN